MDWVFEREIHDEAFLLHGLDCQTMDNGLDPYPNASDPAVIFLFFGIGGSLIFMALGLVL